MDLLQHDKDPLTETTQIDMTGLSRFTKSPRQKAVNLLHCSLERLRSKVHN